MENQITKTGSIRFSETERKEAKTLGLNASEYIRFKMRKQDVNNVNNNVNKDVNNVNKDVNIPVNTVNNLVNSGHLDGSPISLITLASENSALKVENRMLKEQLNAKGGNELNGVELVNVKMTEYELKSTKEKNDRLKEKLEKLSEKWDKASEELAGIDKLDKYLGIVQDFAPKLGETLINAIGNNFPVATERFIDRLAGGTNEVQAQQSLSLEEQKYLSVGKQIIKSFSDTEFEILAIIISKMIDDKTLIAKVKNFIKELSILETENQPQQQPQQQQQQQPQQQP